MTKPRPYKCPICNDQSSHLEHAMSVHMSRRHFICWSAAEPCGQRFESRKELIKHWILTSHDYYCHICDGGYPSEDRFATHACTPRQDAIINGIKCPVCGMMAPTQEAYDRHFEDTAQDSRHFRCTQCHRIFAEENALRMHMQVHRPTIISCPHCDSPFCSHSDLIRHMEVACRFTNTEVIHGLLLQLGHNETCAIPLDFEESQLYFCRGCDRMFDDLGSLAAHMEQSRSCPADVRSEYFQNIMATFNFALQ